MKTVKIICYDITYHRLEELDDVTSFRVDVLEDECQITVWNSDKEVKTVRCTGFSILN